MEKKFAVPRGTSDILPDTVLLWEHLETSARRVLKSYGYREIRTPMYEETALFKRSLGQTSDIVNKQLLELASTKEEGYALRPEGTAAVVRSYLENNLDKKEPLSKLFYIGPMFRGERPQKGRLRQFHQIGVEAIGTNGASPYLDAEIIALSTHLLKEFNVKNFKVKINSLGDEQDKINLSAFLSNSLKGRKNELCEDCQRRLENNPLRLLDCKREECKRIVHGLSDDFGLTASSSKIYLQTVQDLLNNLKIPFEIDRYLVRGLDYYTHTVFEITAEGLGSQDAVGAGGRYSGLVHELGGDEKTDFGAVGFALGIERILLASGQTQGMPSAIDAFVIAMDDKYQNKAFMLVDRLRKAGISADMSYTGGSIKSQMNRANKLNARFTLILGEEEDKNNAVAVKNMQISVQETVPLNDIINVLKNKFS